MKLVKSAHLTEPKHLAMAGCKHKDASMPLLVQVALARHVNDSRRDCIFCLGYHGFMLQSQLGHARHRGFTYCSFLLGHFAHFRIGLIAQNLLSICYGGQLDAPCTNACSPACH